MKPHGKADKCLAWKGPGVERWQEFTITLQAWYNANIDYMSQAQFIQKIWQTFRDAGETAAADSLTYYLVDGKEPPPPLRQFSWILIVF